jgi:hypothetical protein
MEWNICIYLFDPNSKPVNISLIIYQAQMKCREETHSLEKHTDRFSASHLQSKPISHAIEKEDLIPFRKSLHALLIQSFLILKI